MSQGSSSTPQWLQHARDHWTNRGQRRPDFAIEPNAGQESVWDYPRPPAVVRDQRTVEVHSNGQVIASTSQAIRILETSHPPSFYVPPESVADGSLVPVPGGSHCEWKGQAEYFGVQDSTSPVGWRYPKPYPEFKEWTNYVSFYPDLVECYVDGERVGAQPGGFYGGWITSDVVGPFKGEPGTSGW